MRRIALIALRVVCYLALLLIAGALLTIYLLDATGACTTMNEAGTVCGSDFARSAADTSIGILLVTVFTGLPLLFVLGGIVFLVIDSYRLLTRQRS